MKLWSGVGANQGSHRGPREYRDVNGILLVDKDKGWTSHDVCAMVRKRFQIKKVGHAGTLDPQATGLLVLLLGMATKRSNELSGSDKEYSGVIRLGVETDSYDSQGKVIAERDWSHVTEDRVREAFQQFRGTIEQKPPMVSAIKQNGVRLYKLARAGKVVDRASRVITVYEFRIDKIEMPRIYFYARVSKGTYLRTLVHDLGQVLGCGGILEDLKRVRAGNYDVGQAVSVPELKEMSWDDFSKRIQEQKLAVIKS